MIQIDKNVPMTGKTGAPSKYPYAVMEIGDSFFVPGKKGVGQVFNPATVSPKKFTGRVCAESGVSGVRIWRVA